MLPQILILAIAALLTSIISAVLGMAGGITLLGVMAIVLPAPAIVPIHGVVQLSSNVTRSIVFLKDVHWPIVRFFGPAVIVGMFTAAQLYSGGRLPWMKTLIGSYILAFLLWRRFAVALLNPPLWSYSVLGIVVGFISLFVGATGPFLAPFFLRDDFRKEQVIATKAFCQLLTHLLKIPIFSWLGFAFIKHLPLLGVLVVAVICGTLLGKRILLKMGQKTFVRLFELALGLTGAYLVYAGLR